MDSSDSQEPALAPKNSLATVSRKFKSIFDTDQQPSVRILRASRRSAEPKREEAPPPAREPSSGFFASLRSRFGRRDEAYGGQPYGDDEYLPETVELLDVVGT